MTKKQHKTHFEKKAFKDLSIGNLIHFYWKKMLKNRHYVAV